MSYSVASVLSLWASPRASASVAVGSAFAAEAALERSAYVNDAGEQLARFLAARCGADEGDARLRPEPTGGGA